VTVLEKGSSGVTQCLINSELNPCFPILKVLKKMSFAQKEKLISQAMCDSYNNTNHMPIASVYLISIRKRAEILQF